MIQIIPAIDIIDGKCVRLSKGDYGTARFYSSDPVQVAKELEDHGIKRLHMVDLDGARQGKVVNYRILEKVASQTGLVIDFSGGIKDDQQRGTVLESGAEIITIGSLAIRDRALLLKWLEEMGPEKLIVAADSKHEKIMLDAWQASSEIDMVDYIRSYYNEGVQQFLCTDVEKDGMLDGPATRVYKQIISKVPGSRIIASGGVRSVEDIVNLSEAGLHGVVFGKALYEGLISFKDLRKALLI